ncbi:hypothetical protein N5079_25075 [Planotetraspora sp. A-T 1434]|uniref:hypothetical protein n=1 Tax=Planotetraspora sp. A-T 1434 TaxID=2979219 RepID=UPI0021C1CA18|nr:hypothetical protein [Planotetraspora sp. A-T 1434]MCT9933490.1 hypothetical protein [Planotetraspora sp. A-T 1434]
MKTLLDVRSNRTVKSLSALVGAAALGMSIMAAAPAPAVKLPVSENVVGISATFNKEQVLLSGSTKGSYFWDDASGREGDTGMPAIGKPMQKGLFASPSWPLGTEGYVFYKGKAAKFFIGDRGPGTPSDDGVMLDMDGQTFAELTGTRWNSDTLTVNSDEGHIDVQYVVTKWGDGPGMKGEPVPFSTGAWSG